MSESRTLGRIDWLLLAGLITLILPLRLWLLCNTEVTARDGVGYIRYALEFERYPWQHVLKSNLQHPGYPASIFLMSQAVRGADGEPTPDNMERSAQLVSFFASLVLAVLMYLLGRQFFGRIICFCATLLYQYLPVSAHHLSDGISEPLYLVFLVNGLLHLVFALRDRSAVAGFVCGISSALAYLVRPEGLLIVPAFVAALVLAQLRSEWRSSWSRSVLCLGALLLGVLAITSVYVYATGRITNKLSALETMRNLWHWIGFSSGDAAGAGGAGSNLFAAFFPATDSRALRLQRSLTTLTMELVQGFHYAGALPAALGLLWSFAALRKQTGFWALTIYALMHAFILIALAMSVCYVSDRHVMILVLFGVFFVVIGLRELPRRVLARCRVDAAPAWYRSATVWFALLFLVLLASCLPKATQRLHANRAGNRAAGLWLAEQLMPGDVIEDDHAWSHYYSGLFFEEGSDPAFSADHFATCYVVVTRSRDAEIDNKRLSEKVAKDARVVYTWPTESDRSTARILVYAQPRSFATHPWRVAAK